MTVPVTEKDRGKTAAELRREVDRLLRQARHKALLGADLLAEAGRLVDRADAMQELAEITGRGGAR